jgi:hypothetical protein
MWNEIRIEAQVAEIDVVIDGWVGRGLFGRNGGAPLSCCRTGIWHDLGRGFTGLLGADSLIS